jgi:hypothetical protein
MKKKIIFGLIFSNMLLAYTNEGKAPCTIKDGYQTVYFSNGSSYSGNFDDCHPLSGSAKYFTPDGKFYQGYATSMSSDSVKMNLGQDGYTIIKIEIDRY